MARSRDIIIFNTALIGAVFVVTLDRFAKMFSISVWQFKSHSLISNALSLSFFRNYRIAFSLPTFIDPSYIIAPILLLIAYFFWRKLLEQKWREAAALCCIFLGALSNIYDRLIFGYVIDYVDFRYFTVFNLADCLVITGTIWVSYLLSIKRPKLSHLT